MVGVSALAGVNCKGRRVWISVNIIASADTINCFIVSSITGFL